jgi:hypothetical protein
MRCFFCLQERDPSDEHVFPEAIGGTVTTDRVCKLCNDFLGARVDVCLTDHPTILLKRAEFGMLTRARKVVDPLRQLFSQGTLAADPEKRIQLILDKTTGKLVPKIMYHASRTPLEDGTQNVQITIDESDIGKLETIVQRERKRAGQEPLSEGEIAALITSAKQNMRTLEQPEVVYNVKLDTLNYQRAICKIIYELACMWFGDAYLDDDIAKQIRSFVLDGIKTQVPGVIEFRNDTPTLCLWQSEPKAHIAMTARKNEDIAIAIRVFDAVSAVVIVKRNASQFTTLKDGRFLLIDLVGNGSRSGTLDEELHHIIGRSRSNTT